MAYGLIDFRRRERLGYMGILVESHEQTNVLKMIDTTELTRSGLPCLTTNIELTVGLCFRKIPCAGRILSSCERFTSVVANPTLRNSHAAREFLGDRAATRRVAAPRPIEVRSCRWRRAVDSRKRGEKSWRNRKDERESKRSAYSLQDLVVTKGRTSLICCHQEISASCGAMSYFPAGRLQQVRPPRGSD